MKFFSAIEFLREHPYCIAKPSNNNKPYALNLRFDTEKDCFGWTDSEGKFFPDYHEPNKYKRVILSGKLIDSDCKIYQLIYKPKTVYGYHEEMPIVVFESYDVVTKEI